MAVLILATVAGHTISPLAYLAPDVLDRDRESSLEQQAPEPLYGVMAAGCLVDADRIGPPGRTDDPDIPIRQRPTRSSLYPNSWRTYPWSRCSTILSHLTSPSCRSYRRRTSQRSQIAAARARDIRSMGCCSYMSDKSDFRTYNANVLFSSEPHQKPSEPNPHSSSPSGPSAFSSRRSSATSWWT